MEDAFFTDSQLKILEKTDKEVRNKNKYNSIHDNKEQKQF
jgi:hypothetical protein